MAPDARTDPARQSSLSPVAQGALQRHAHHAHALRAREQRAYAREGESLGIDAADPYRPRIHVSPPFGRLNDPNGLVYHNGVWHAYYQFTPLFPEKGVFWRHAVSEDLVRWHDRGSVLSPIDFFDTHGCYSGCAVIPHEDEADARSSLEFFYTGNVKDEHGAREAYQVLAVSNDGGATLTKASNNPVIDSVAQGYTAHFRDPDVTWRGDHWQMLLGAQRDDGSSAIVRYTSRDRRRWTFEGSLEFVGLEEPIDGYMIECPVFMSLTNERGEVKDVLLMCPQGMTPGEGCLENRDHLAYIVGTLDGSRFRCESGVMELDAGFEVYAPQVFTGVQGRHVLMLWLGNPGQDAQPSQAYGWVHCLSVPRELELRGSRLLQRPVRELERVWTVERRAARLSEPATVLGSGFGRIRMQACVMDGEIEVEIRGPHARARVRVQRAGMTVDRGASEYVPDGPRSAVRHRRWPPRERHDLDIVLDASVLEIFADDGALSFSCRVFVGEVQSVRVIPRAGAYLEQLAVAEFSV